MAIQFHTDHERLARLGNTRRFEKKAVNSVETIQDIVRKELETEKNSQAHAEQEISSISKDV